MRKILSAVVLGLGTFITAQTYCTPAFSNGCSGGDQIDSFTIPTASFNHASTGCSTNAYGDFTSMNITLSAGLNYQYSITHGYSSQNVRIWVDFNHDGTFDETTELISQGTSATVSGVNTTNGVINLPVSTALGNYRMRVADRWNSAPIPCNVDGYGETHDYTLVVTSPPSCLTPTNITTSNIGTSTATLGWAASPSSVGVGYEYYYSSSNVAPTATTAASGSVGSTVTSVPLASLTPATTYYTWVRSVCSTTDKSVWASGSSFTTNCISTNVPYTLGFNNVTIPALPQCTSAVNYGTGNTWDTYDYSWNPASGITGQVLRYVYNSASPADTWFFTQGLNLTSGVSYRLRFKYVTNAGVSYSENLKVAYGNAASNTAMTNVIVDLPGLNNETVIQGTYFITPSSTGVYYIGFQSYSLADQNSIFIDDIEVVVAPTCNEPSGVVISNITSSGASVNWTAPTSLPANGYEYYYSTSSTSPSASTAAMGTSPTTSANLSTLTPGNQYYIWVRSVCSSTNKSEWSQVASFLTSCVTVQSFTQNFDSTPVDAVPVCWSSIGSVANYTRVYATGAMSGPNALYIYGDGASSGMAALPEVTTLQTGNYVLKFKGRANFTPGGIVEIGYLTNPTDNTSFVSLGSYTSTSVTTIDNFSLNITGVPAGVSRLVLKHTGTPGYSVLIDDVEYVLNTSMAVSETGIKNDTVKAYPNPFTDIINITDAEKIKSISVMDASGKLIKTITKPNNQIHLGELSSGMYLLVLNNNDGTKQTIKVLKK